ncbi:LysE family translocator [Bacillus sp. sid0103]|uniref:LysE family translocator n=1 Tax=Bacillus sp. sid0103 TaxID=2856337 RepID=UPI001C483456|nr:LysE family translocator [Bacillus sp. sid0103]MBV7508915.1 LysE family translocator [Bacillus sp. sid0103]
MEILVFLKGLVIGFSIAAPVGPIGVLVIKRTLGQGRIYGIVSGVGAASADALYGLIAGLGLTVITSFFIGQQFWFHLAGGAFLCYLGVKIAISEASENPARVQGQHLGAYSSVFLLTLTNPMTILSFVGIFSGLGLTQANEGSVVTLVLGVFMGSGIWWLLLCFVVGLFKEVLKKQTLIWINRLSGLIIFLFGIYSFWGLLH